MIACPSGHRRLGGRPRLLRLAALALGFLLCSCRQAPAVGSFPWTGEDGARLAFRQSANWEAGSEGSFGAARLSNRYTLEKPLSLKAGQAIELSVRMSAASALPRLKLSLNGGDRKALVSADFPIRDERSRLVLALDSDARVASLSVELGGEQEKAAIEIQGIAVRSAFRGIEAAEASAGGLKVSSGFSMRLEAGRKILSISRPFVSKPAPGEKVCIELSYGAFAGQASAEIKGGPKPLRLRLRSSGGREVLGSELFPEALAGVELSVPEKVPVPGFFSCPVPAAEAELADLGRVLLSSPSPADSDYSLYRWSILPTVLVFDFRDYATQDRYLKRLAFFVEKAGFRGRLAADAEIAALHGWNAHDYRSEDLAAFFQAAAARSFPLGPEERALGTLLLERGLIRRSSGKIVAGQGALISISRESPPYQRLTLLVHESTHGIFFCDAEYRDYARSVWAEVSKDERWFWRLYFDWANYDVSSDYLMLNEYQAYLLQQPVARAEEYFTKLLPSRLVEKHPERQEPLDVYMARFGTRFAENAALLEGWLAKKYGIAAGRTWFLD
jgi:hypothetical protein